MRRILTFSFVLLSFFLTTTIASAQVRTDYTAEYFLFTNQESKVQLHIKTTNLKSDVLVKKFSILFPQNFQIQNVSAFDDYGQVMPLINPQDKNIKVDLIFNDPKIGKDEVNNFYLTFEQNNLFQVPGNIGELILPVLQDAGKGQYKIIVTLPTGFDKKLSIAKPRPSSISGDQILWENVSDKTIYAVFGDKQYYAMELAYHLKNEQVFPNYAQIALPPDTSYQKLFVQSLEPKPVSVSLDEDGNYMAKYVLGPKEEKNIVFTGQVSLVSRPRYTNQVDQPYLLTPSQYWQTNQSRFNSAQTIYDFVTKNLQYNYEKIGLNNKRLGAALALEAGKGTCSEFTDLFVALSRKSGIYSREIEGFAFSQDQTLRPFSLNTDLLHSWPEYYDSAQKIWVSVDPTWGNTSGIDYFHALDLNHIAFVIHGKDPTLPYPAGMYKTKDSKDVKVEPIDKPLQELINLKLVSFNLVKDIDDRKVYKAKLVISNQGNTFLRNFSINIDSLSLQWNHNKIIVDVLAPFEVKEIELAYKASDGIQKTSSVTVSAFKQILFKDIINISRGGINVKQVITTLSFLVVFGIIAKILLNKRKTS